MMMTSKLKRRSSTSDLSNGHDHITNNSYYVL
jgi:hypothetical protein